MTRRGFTLVELLAVCAIICILAGIVIGSASAMRHVTVQRVTGLAAKVDAIAADVGNIGSDVGQRPSREEVLRRVKESIEIISGANRR